jgi:cytidylate kinase
MTRPSTIAIDGPAASGKTTLGQQLADALGYLYIDTGMMYRAVTLAALERGIDVDDEAAVTSLAETLVIDVRRSGLKERHPSTVYLNGIDVTNRLRNAEVDAHVSAVSAYLGVRSAMTLQQRRIGERGQIVMVGRDIGTVVLPDADLKLYLDAAVEERARRRWHDYQDDGNGNPYKDVLDAMRKRDAYDSQREHAPLRPAEDAVILDTTHETPEEVIRRVMALIEVGNSGVPQRGNRRA